MDTLKLATVIEKFAFAAPPPKLPKRAAPLLADAFAIVREENDQDAAQQVAELTMYTAPPFCLAVLLMKLPLLIVPPTKPEVKMAPPLPLEENPDNEMPEMVKTADGPGLDTYRPPPSPVAVTPSEFE